MSITRIQDNVFLTLSIDKKKKLGFNKRDTDSLSKVDDQFETALQGFESKDKNRDTARENLKKKESLEEEWARAQEMFFDLKDEKIGSFYDFRG